METMLPRSKAVILSASWAVVMVPSVDGQTACEDRPTLRGQVTDESGSVPLPGATIVVQWTDVIRRSVRESASSDGSFLLCAPRDAVRATAWAEFGDYSSPEVVVDFDVTSQPDLELRVVVAQLPGARLTGRVYDADSGDPITAATLEIPARARQATTDSRGRFSLTGIPSGEFEIRVDHLGYELLRQSVSTEAGHTTELEVGLVRTPLELEPIVVTATRIRRLEIQGFYERKYWGDLTGLGTFFTVADIDRRRPLRISHMIADAPGIRLACSGSGMFSCHLENSRLGCRNVNAYIDGVPLRGGSIDEFIQPIEVGGIEVYAGAAQLPAEFAGSNAQCGAVVIWTR